MKNICRIHPKKILELSDWMAIPVEPYRIQLDRLKKLREERNSSKMEKTLNDLRKAAEGEENLMPYILEASKAYATLGEISDTMREVFGEYQEPPTF